MPEISKIKLPSGNVYDIKDAVAREMIQGGVSFIVAWDGISTPVIANIPAGVTVKYQETTYTGTLSANDAQAGAFYLIADTSGALDIYDEYVPVGGAGSEGKYWEKIGNTAVDLSNVVTDVSLSKATSTFVTGYANPTTDSVIGADATFSVTQPTISVTPSTASINTAGTAASVISSVTDTKKKLATTSVIGVGDSTTTASKATATTSQTTATGALTASTTNTDILKGASVTDEVLILGAATLNTQTTTQFTFADVNVPVKDANATIVATGKVATTDTNGDDVMVGTSTNTANVATVGEAITVATGISSASASGAAVAFDNKDQVSVLTALGTASTATGLTDGTSLVVTKGNE